jgi:hypothetical protein
MELISRHTDTVHIIMVHARIQEWVTDQPVHLEVPREVAIWEAEDEKISIFRKKVLEKFGISK